MENHYSAAVIAVNVKAIVIRQNGGWYVSGFERTE